jgi:hypothetical protein
MKVKGNDVKKTAEFITDARESVKLILAVSLFGTGRKGKRTPGAPLAGYGQASG